MSTIRHPALRPFRSSDRLPGVFACSCLVLFGTMIHSAYAQQTPPRFTASTEATSFDVTVVDDRVGRWPVWSRTISPWKWTSARVVW